MMNRVLDWGAAAGAGAASVASAAAGICCLGPVGLTLLGVQGSILAAGLQPYRGWLLAGSGMLLVAAHWSLRRRLTTCDRSDGATCPPHRGGWTRRLIWGASALWLFSLVLPLLTGLFGY